MTKRALIIASIIGLVATIVSVLLLSHAAADQTVALVVLALDTIAAGIAGRVILGRVVVHRYFRLGLVVLPALAALLFTTAGTNYLIGIDVAFGRADYAPSVAVWATAIVALVIYLIAATIYGFAGTRQGVRVGSRVGLLLLLLLAVLPVVNVLGLLCVGITAIVRGAATPKPAVASE